jgi:tRNA(Arg) A34 adenosine deaminase TadA
MTPADLHQLRRCVALAAEAAARGDDPFGSVLVDARGQVLAERANLVHTHRDNTAHPELMLASWACQHMTPEERAAATMYTSGEHCPMCAAAHVWAGIGRLVFVLSSEQIGALLGPGPAIAVTARELIARSNVAVAVEGPCEELAAEASALFTRGGQP